jgi:hypothetical protein
LIIELCYFTDSRFRNSRRKAKDKTELHHLDQGTGCKEKRSAKTRSDKSRFKKTCDRGNKEMPVRTKDQAASSFLLLHQQTKVQF